MIIYYDTVVENHLTSLNEKGESLTPKYNIEETNNKWFAFVYDQRPVIRIKTSKNKFVFKFHDFIWINSDFNSGLSIEITDLYHNNQNWIQLDHTKYSLTINDVEKTNKTVLNSFSLAIKYSFIIEISSGNWRQSKWESWKIYENSDEDCIDSKIDDLNTIDNKDNNLKRPMFKLVLKWTILIVLIFILIATLSIIVLKFIYIWIKCKLFSKLLGYFKIRTSNATELSKFSNEVSVVAFRIDPPEYIKTSIQSSIRLKVEEEQKHQLTDINRY